MEKVITLNFISNQMVGKDLIAELVCGLKLPVIIAISQVPTLKKFLMIT